MKAAIEVMKNKEMGSCRVSRFINVPQTTLQRYVKDLQRKAQVRQ